MKFKDVPHNTEFYWNPRKDDIPSITCKAVKLPENAGLYQSYVEEPDLDDLEYINAIGHDTNTGHFSFYHVEDDDEVELVDTPIKFKDIAVGVYFYRWPDKNFLYMKVEEVARYEYDKVDERGVDRPMNAVVVDLQHHDKKKLYYFKPNEYIRLWNDQMW